MSELFDDLKKLAEMRDKGEVTQSEYDKIKAELVAEMEGVAPSDELTDTPGATSEKETAQPTPARSRASDAGKWLDETAPRLGKAIPADAPNLLKQRGFWVIVAIIVLVILANLGGSSGGSGENPSEPSPASPEHEAVEAYVVCQQFVEDRLRAPSTAEFGGPYSRVTTDNGGGEYTVRTYVDAENAFGAMIRNNFTCTVQHTSGDNYRLVDLTMSEE